MTVQTCVQDEWTYVSPMSTARAGVSVAAISGLLYAFGGRTSSSEFCAPVTLASVECYYPELDEWMDAGQMPVARCEAGIGVLWCFKTTVFCGKVFKILRTSLPDSMAHHGNFSRYSNIFYKPLNLTKYAVFVSHHYRNWQIRSVYQINWQYGISDQFNISNIPPTKSSCGSHFIFRCTIMSIYI